MFVVARVLEEKVRGSCCPSVCEGMQRSARQRGDGRVTAIC